MEKQLEFLAQLGQAYGDECVWPLDATEEPTQFYLRNNSFSFGCAAALHTMVRHYKPKHFIEIGSGFSSKVIANALNLNRRDDPSLTSEYIIIDPFPGKVIETHLQSSPRIVKERVECVTPHMFEVLERDDILFVDSGHTIRTGSDVNFLILDVLPMLHDGVIVHFHDINLPYEYQKVYFTNPQFRMFWTEAYLLQAFLAFNQEFEVLLAMNYIQTDYMSDFCMAFPHFNLADNWANSGSFWIRRRQFVGVQK
jgi:hypothetical protein